MAVDVEIVFNGLCSFLNVRDTNNDMPEPSVILVRTDKEPPPNTHPPTEMDDMDDMGDGDSGGTTPHVPHKSFLAFDSKTIRIDDASGFVRVPEKADFWSLTLSGVLIKIKDDNGQPTVDGSYDDVLKKDRYWPEAANLFNRDYVPERGKKPKKTAVNAFLRFGSGTITAGRLSTVQWKFIRNDGQTYINYFAEEVVYSGFGHSGDTIVIELYDLFTDQRLRTLTFFARTSDVDMLTLFIGNNTKAGIVDALNRAPKDGVQPKDGSHIAYLNAVADPDVSPYGPIPKAVPQPVPLDDGSGPVVEENLGGGGSDGFCGPGSANG
jgi:hypothetical protein